MLQKNESLISLDNAGIFRDRKWLVRGVSMTVEPGEIVTLIGPNGSGKSTLASVISGREEYEVTKGEIILENEDIEELSDKASSAILSLKAR